MVVGAAVVVAVEGVDATAAAAAAAVAAAMKAAVSCGRDVDGCG